MFNIKYEIFVNNEKYCVRRLVLQLCITLHCRIDDIQDNSALRRGTPAAHTVYGVASTLSAAMCVYFKSMQMVLSFNHPDCLKLYTEMLLELWRGQATEISWRGNHTCPSEEEYLDVFIKGKAVPLQAWSCPECSRKLRFPNFMTMAQDGGKVVILTHRPPLPSGNTPGTYFC